MAAGLLSLFLHVKVAVKYLVGLNMFNPSLYTSSVPPENSFLCKYLVSFLSYLIVNIKHRFNNLITP